jgi:hypothetical protein
MALEQRVLKIFQEAWTTLKNHPILCLPTFLASIGILIIESAVLRIRLASTEIIPISSEVLSLKTMSSLVGGVPLLIATAMVLGLMAHGATVVMARETVERKGIEFLSAMKIFRQRLAPLFLAGVLIAVLVLFGTLFLLIPGLIAAFLLMFTIPAVMLDRMDPAGAVARSFNTVRHHLGEATLVFIGFVVLVFLWFIASRIFGVVPILGDLINLFLGSLAAGYMTLVLVQYYLRVI